jgi:hypothetical protein
MLDFFYREIPDNWSYNLTRSLVFATTSKDPLSAVDLDLKVYGFGGE